MPQNDIVHLGRVDFGTVEDFLDDDAAQFGSGNIAQGAAEIPHCGADRRNNSDAAHKTLLLAEAGYRGPGRPPYIIAVIIPPPVRINNYRWSMHASGVRAAPPRKALFQRERVG